MNQGGNAAIFWGPNSPHASQYANRLNARMYNIHYLLHKRPWLAPIKYIPQFIKTWVVLYRQKPQLVYVVISPVFAALSVYVYCTIRNIPYVMDVHTHSLTSLKWAWTIPLQRFLAKHALVNIVDQSRHKHLFESWGAKAVILERPPANIPDKRLKKVDPSQKFTITVISTFASDEPLDIVTKAAAHLTDVTFYILGDKALAKKTLLKNASKNVIFPGYLLGDDYWNILYSSQAIMSLTTHPYSLLSGAIETMALGIPPILSRQPILTEYFTKGAIFVDHSVESIIEGIRQLQREKGELTKKIIELSVEKRDRWEKEFKELLSLIGRNHCKTL